RERLATAAADVEDGRVRARASAEQLKELSQGHADHVLNPDVAGDQPRAEARIPDPAIVIGHPRRAALVCRVWSPTPSGISFSSPGCPASALSPTRGTLRCSPPGRTPSASPRFPRSRDGRRRLVAGRSVLSTPPYGGRPRRSKSCRPPGRRP